MQQLSTEFVVRLMIIHIFSCVLHIDSVCRDLLPPCSTLILDRFIFSLHLTSSVAHMKTHSHYANVCVCVCIFRVINFAAACVRCMECRIISMRIYRLVNWFEYESNGYFFNGTGLFSACFFLYVYRVFVWFISSFSEICSLLYYRRLSAYCVLLFPFKFLFGRLFSGNT